MNKHDLETLVSIQFYCIQQVSRWYTTQYQNMIYALFIRIITLLSKLYPKLINHVCHAVMIDSIPEDRYCVATSGAKTYGEPLQSFCVLFFLTMEIQ